MPGRIRPSSSGRTAGPVPLFMWGAKPPLPITLIDSCSAVKVLLVREDRPSSTAPLVPLVHWQDFCRTCGRWRALGRAKDRFQCMCCVRVNFTHFTDVWRLQHSYVWEGQAVFVRTVGIMPLSLPSMPTPYLSRLNFIVMIFAFFCNILSVYTAKAETGHAGEMTVVRV